MVRLLCHAVYQNAELFQIVPTKENVKEEFVLYLKNCVICEQPVLEIRRIDIWGCGMEPVRVKTKNIQKFLDSMSVIWKPGKIHPVNVVHSKFSLGYNEFGTRKKCFQNLSNLYLGRVETDPYENLKNYKNRKLKLAKQPEAVQLVINF